MIDFSNWGFEYVFLVCVWPYLRLFLNFKSYVGIKHVKVCGIFFLFSIVVKQRDCSFTYGADVLVLLCGTTLLTPSNASADFYTRKDVARLEQNPSSRTHSPQPHTSPHDQL